MHCAGLIECRHAMLLPTPNVQGEKQGPQQCTIIAVTDAVMTLLGVYWNICTIVAMCDAVHAYSLFVFSGEERDCGFWVSRSLAQVGYRSTSGPHPRTMHHRSSAAIHDESLDHDFLAYLSESASATGVGTTAGLRRKCP